MRKINVLSLCNGISVGQIALHKAGIEYKYYVSSEIDKYAIKATHNNFPSTIEIGDIFNVNVDNIPFDIDLVISGTPCQGFSLAGKQLKFDEPRSQLFFQFCRILKRCKEYNPKVKFLFENVRMDKQSEMVITTMLGVQPLRIDSALVCAQTRKRNYWTNIEGIQQPADRGIILQDILEDVVDPKYYLSDKILQRINKDAVVRELYRLRLQREKSRAVISSVGRTTDREYFERNQGQLIGVSQVNPAKEFGSQPRNQNRKYDSDGKSPCLTDSKAANTNIIVHNLQPRNGKGQGGKGHLCKSGNKAYCLTTGSGGGQAVEVVAVISNAPKVAIAGAIRGRYQEDGAIVQQLELNNSGKSNALTTVEKDNVVICSRDGKIKRNQDKAGTITVGGHGSGNHSDMDVLKQAHPLNAAIGVVNSYGSLRKLEDDKSLNIDANYWKGMDNHGQRTHILNADLVIRRLTPIECERLMGLPDNYTAGLSDTQRYRSIGNAWQADTIAHILSYYKP